MFKLASILLKTIPSIFYVVELNLYFKGIFENWVTPFWKFIIIYGVPSSIMLFTILYFFIFKDSLVRQKAKESDEDESRIYTVKIQLARMVRKYIPLATVGIIVALMVYFYKPNIIAVSIKVGLLYFYFLLGETCRIIDIGIKERKRDKKELGL